MYIAAPRVWRYNQERRAYLGKQGVVVSWSVVRNGPEGLSERTPYVVAIIDVGGERLMGQVVDMHIDELTIGMNVIGVMRRLFDVDPDQVVVYGIKWKKNESH